MTDDTNAPTEESNTIDRTLAIDTSYKVRGYNTTGSGVTCGVLGKVDSPDGFGLYTPDSGRVDGDIETTGSHALTVGGDRALKLGSTTTDSSDNTVGGNVVGGYEGNQIQNSAIGATIGGGGKAGTFGFDDRASENRVTGDYGTVGGGFSNWADQQCVVAGGRANTAGDSTDENSGFNATVGGGQDNLASGSSSTVPGGAGNVAAGLASFAAGTNAKAADMESFVWNDASKYHDDPDLTGDGLSSAKDIAGSGVTGTETFHVSAQGGIRFITGSDRVTYISGGTTGWAITSTRTAKTNIDPVDTRDALDGVESMEIATWEYRDEDGDGQGERHIGPMAEDFHDAFDVGESDEHINSINADGVLFAALQGLSAKVDERTDRIDDLEAENEQLREELEERDERIDELEDRLEAIESHLETDAPVSPADD